jgi:uncharacterized membrane protein YeaQ/YmgE (transglycosylase-associated protein family)
VSFIAWLLVGAIAGWLAGLVMSGRGFGVLGNIVVGILGSFIGGFLALESILVAFVGAVVLLLILRLIPGRQPFER